MKIARDGRAAVAADLDEISGGGLAGAGDGENLFCLLHDVAFDDKISCDVTGGTYFGGPVRRFEIALGGAVVTAQERADFGGVAGATQVFEEEAVEECGTFLGGEGKFAGDAHADETGSRGMSGGLALGDVQSVGEGRNDFRESDSIGRGIFQVVLLDHDAFPQLAMLSYSNTSS